MTEYLGRPAGYSPWPGRLLRALEWLLGFLLRLALAVTVGTVLGVAVGALACLALVLWVLGGDPVEPAP